MQLTRQGQTLASEQTASPAQSESRQQLPWGAGLLHTPLTQSPLSEHSASETQHDESSATQVPRSSRRTQSATHEHTKAPEHFMSASHSSSRQQPLVDGGLHTSTTQIESPAHSPSAEQQPDESQLVSSTFHCPLSQLAVTCRVGHWS